jgi:hypothetical protein
MRVAQISWTYAGQACYGIRGGTQFSMYDHGYMRMYMCESACTHVEICLYSSRMYMCLHTHTRNVIEESPGCEWRTRLAHACCGVRRARSTVSYQPAQSEKTHMSSLMPKHLCVYVCVLTLLGDEQENCDGFGVAQPSTYAYQKVLCNPDIRMPSDSEAY